MIKAITTRTGCRVEVKGKNSELLAELTAIIEDFLKEEVATEEIIDIVVGLAKAGYKGETKKYMADTLTNVIVKKLEDLADELKDEEDED